ncbi:uncharacterized protein LOC125191410 [Salvia hispanica]|uniref:uncharacterized protein LOC125191410 n=1 Tax=Salvia hispanica TaxID=49212 RepID=UPI00200915C5|nr:uncharacterized protein LOC125191410 [Salvia hispanica]XP_047944923.1 uncharacterized protein LOC125191410 [Salvia hispanica]XP_047944924.1 uncharacterized protein LOC125191410 [Salvia hispanica]XP_047944925.1 uncharacterized protein LOC125191410 [Salvia hispanica]XP_047944926.1 uncharacterized protein LOC125191410 [Salvia hispanica]XP_047944927.1 uncharacterized protein LOC125191410 [Salvia hispanica]XP_047944928.1 uncharacterized protein LOC125191410 [Salvia hispanica]
MLKRDPRMVITIDQVYPEDTVFTKGKDVLFHAIYLEFVMRELRHTPEVRRQQFWLVWGKFARLSSWCSSPLGTYILIRSIRKVARFWHVCCGEDIYEWIESCIKAKDKMVAIEGFWTLEGVVGISRCTIVEDHMDVMRPNLRSHQRVVRFSAHRALQKVGIVHNLDLDVIFYNLCLEKFNHRYLDEPEAEQVPQVIKTELFAVKEASTHHCNLRLRLVIGNHQSIVHAT